MLILPAPAALMILSLSSVNVSGRPASTVNSLRFPVSNRSVILDSSSSSCDSFSVVGVPPPMYIDSRGICFSFIFAAQYLAVKRLQISVDLRLRHLVRSEGAVQASRRAEWYTYVHPETSRLRTTCCLPLILQYVRDQIRFVLMEQIFLFQYPLQFYHAAA